MSFIIYYLDSNSVLEFKISVLEYCFQNYI